MNNTVKQIGLLVFISVCIAGAINGFHPRSIPWVGTWSVYVEAKAAEQGIPVIPFRVAMDRFNSGASLFVDARPWKDYEEGHIPGALPLPYQALDNHAERMFDLLDESRPLIVYCSSRDCDDALWLAVELKEMGAEQLVLYVDGFEVWYAAGAPTKVATGDNVL